MDERQILKRIIGRLEKGAQVKLNQSIFSFGEKIATIYGSELDTLDDTRRAILKVLHCFDDIRKDLIEDYNEAVNEHVLEGNDSFLSYLEEYPQAIGMHLEYVNCIEDYMMSAKYTLLQSFDNIDLTNSIYALGLSLSNTIIVGMDNETEVIPYTAAIMMQETHKSAEVETKKKATANACHKRQIDSKEIQDRVIKIYQDLKEKNPELSKDAASLIIGELGKINRAPKVIRRYLNGL